MLNVKFVLPAVLLLVTLLSCASADLAPGPERARSLRRRLPRNNVKKTIKKLGGETKRDRKKRLEREARGYGSVANAVKRASRSAYGGGGVNDDTANGISDVVDSYLTGRSGRSATRSGPYKKQKPSKYFKMEDLD